MPALAPSGRADFPDGFVFGVATAAFQIEGALDEDGRVPSIWDTFAARPGTIERGETGKTACDHYHRYADDVALMAALGVDAYRFSLAWPRILPEPGRPNPAGIAFYDRLLDELLAAGITPWATLYHWDLPESLEAAGGWPARETAYRFAEYAALAADRFGDRIGHWLTVNEPFVSSMVGYASGVHAPGRVDPAAAVRAAHHLMLGHGLAMRELRARHPDAQVGLALSLTPVEAFEGRAEFTDAVRRVDGMCNRLFLDPLLRGSYPGDVVADLAHVSDLAHVADGDLALVGAPVDFLGVNYYHPTVVTGGFWPGSAEAATSGSGRPRCEMGWEVDPDGLTRLLRRLHEDDDSPTIDVTENGSAWPDTVTETPDGGRRVADPERTAYLQTHLQACRDAIAAGVDLRGYFAWSLLDNFEWAFGYRMRFGLVHVDFGTQVRTVKDSGRWYAALLGAGARP